ncbi:Pentatricopeptide repeat [Dillenia turbinata]|uniref:Pentatricopeptide repeat n=1 Tax=Dillenia turbinata TaxID=194707 RepID=A0AAN8W0R6_9MAGN
MMLTKRVPLFLRLSISQCLTITGQRTKLLNPRLSHSDSKEFPVLTNLVSSGVEIIELVKERSRDWDQDQESMILVYNSALIDLVNKAFNLLKAMMGDDDGTPQPDTTSFNILIDGLCEHNMLDLAVGLVKNMVDNGYKRNLLIYNNLINALCNSDRVEECYELLREMKESGREDVVGALDLVKEMRVYGHEPWIKHCTMLARRLCRRGQAEEASNFLANMAQEGFLPDMIAYSATIDGFFKIKKVDEGLKLFRDLCGRGYCPDVVAYNTLINGFCKAKRMSESQDIFNEMIEKGLAPSVITYNVLVDGWCKGGDMEQAIHWLSKMVGEGQTPNVITYTTIIDGLCSNGRPNDALLLWNEMVGKGCLPNRVTYMAIIYGLCKCSKPDTALHYLDEMEKKEMKPDTYVYVALVSAFMSESNPGLAFQILKKLIDDGSFPEPCDKNYAPLKEATLQLSKDPRTSLNIQMLISKGRLPTNFSSLDMASEDDTESDPRA